MVSYFHTSIFVRTVAVFDQTSKNMALQVSYIHSPVWAQTRARSFGPQRQHSASLRLRWVEIGKGFTGSHPWPLTCIPSRVSGCADHFAAVEKEAYEYTRNIISTLNFKLPENEAVRVEQPLHSVEELKGLAPRDYNHSLDIRLVLSCLTDGSRFQEFKARYGTTLVTGFAKIEGQLVGIIANNGELRYEAALKGSHFIQLCDQRDVPLIFLQNTGPSPALTLSSAQAVSNTNRLKAQGSMMSAVACASVPKITLVIGGCHGPESYAMCGRAFEPNFLFLWPNARVSYLAPGHAGSLLQVEEEIKRINNKLEEESSAFFSSGRLWDDGVILPQDTRKVLGTCLRIIKQQDYQISREKHRSPLLRM